jgi:hypothetical protein
MESYNKLPSEMTRLEPWAWWTQVMKVWALANICFTVGPLLELIQRRWYGNTSVTKGVFFFLILVLSVLMISQWAMAFRRDYFVAGESIERSFPG